MSSVARPSMRWPSKGPRPRPDHAAEGAERRRLAGAVGAEEGRDAAFGEAELEPVQGLGLAVKGLEALDVEQRRHLRPVPR